MAFDVDVFRAAHRPWSFTIGARTFGARHVSAVAVAAYERRASDALARARTHPRAGLRASLAALAWLLRRAFPWRPSYLIRGDPVRIILALEPAARAEALRDFFGCLRGVGATPLTTRRPVSPTLEHPGPSTRGTRSPAPTPLPSP